MDEFNRPDSPYRSIIADCILDLIDGFSTDRLTVEAADYLIANWICEPSYSKQWGKTLARYATPELVSTRLLPLGPSLKSPHIENMDAILRKSGKRHGRQYVTI